MQDFEELALGGQDFEDMGTWESDGFLGEWEAGDDFEGFDDGSDPFIGSALRRARKRLRGAIPRGLTKKLLQQAATMGAQALGSSIGGPQGAALAASIANRVLRESDDENDFEDDYESEADFEAQFEAMGGDLEALSEMEALAEMIAESEDEAEADHFIGALAGLATKLLPKAIPLIGQGIRAVGGLLGRSRRSRPLVQALPRVAARTAMNLQRRRATPRRVVGHFSRNLAHTLANRRRLAYAMRPTRSRYGGASYRPYSSSALTRQPRNRRAPYPYLGSAGRRRLRGRRLAPVFALVR